MQVPSLSIAFMIVSAIISIGLPIALFIFSYKKYNAKIFPLIFGMAGFIIFALILEQAIHSLVLGNFQLKDIPPAYILYGIFMAGIFEETARFISFKILKKKCTGIETAISYGIGHGGAEAIIIAGLSLIYAVIFSITLNTGNVETITGKLQGGALEQTNNLIITLTTTPSYTFLLGGFERIFAMCMQMSCSVIVFYSVYGTKKLWLYPLAILLHAIIDIPAAAMQVGLIKNVLVVEFIAFLSAIALIIIAKYTHERLKQSTS